MQMHRELGFEIISTDSLGFTTNDLVQRFGVTYMEGTKFEDKACYHCIYVLGED